MMGAFVGRAVIRGLLSKGLMSWGLQTYNHASNIYYACVGPLVGPSVRNKFKISITWPIWVGSER